MHKRIISSYIYATILTIFLTGCQNRLSALSSLNLASLSSNSTGAPYVPAAPVNLASSTFPLEVMGAAGSIVSVNLNLTGQSVTGINTLYVRTHGLNNNAEGSVKVNGGTWIPLSNSTVKVQGTPARYGGIGGAFFTIKMNVPITTSLVNAGQNTISFRFNGTDGRSSGYRVLELNFLETDGSMLLPASSFVHDDPTKWTPPLNNPADIAAGKMLWTSAQLFDSPLKSTTPMLAKCMDCHTATGSDLKYFNYSNFSIQQRAMFHGLTSQQGLQIASYIRSLTGPAPGNPWDPPYQPGPGLDSKPINAWSAGAGIDAVVSSDSGTQQYLPANVDAFRDQGTHGMVFNRYSVREVPVDFELLDWNHWLPSVSPMDGLGSVSAFQATTTYQLYQKIRTGLSGSGNAAYVRSQFINDAGSWGFEVNRTLGPQLANANGYGTLAAYKAVYNSAVWSATKMWEVMQEFNLEGVGPSLYGSRGESRSWIAANRFIFDISPHGTAGPAGVDFSAMLLFGDPNLGNSCPKSVKNPTGDCVRVLGNQLARQWYEEQLMLNAGQRQSAFGGMSTIDWGYMVNFVQGVTPIIGQMEPMQQARFAFKQFDEHDTGFGEIDQGPGYALGWNYRDNSTFVLNLRNFYNQTGDYSTVQGGSDVVKTVYQAYLEHTARMGISTFQGVLGTGYLGCSFPPANYIFGSGSFPANGAVGDNLNRSVADGWNYEVEALTTKYNMPQALISSANQYSAALWPNNFAGNRGLASVSGSAPTGVSVISGVDQISLTWNPSSGANSYNVKRATSANESHYQTVKMFVSGTSYTDYNLDPGVTYYYKVSANTSANGVTDQLESADSNVVAGNSSVGLVSKWELGGLSSGQSAPDLGSGSLSPGAVYTDLQGNNYVSVRQNLAQWLGRTATMSAWVQLPSGFRGAGNVFEMPTLAGSVSGDGQNFTFGAVNGTGQVGLGFYDCGSTKGAITSAFSTVKINDGAMHFVALSRELTNGNIAVYVDGVLSASATASKASCQGARVYSLGRPEGGTNFLGGTMKDVRIYNGALTAATIKSMYTAGPQ